MDDQSACSIIDNEHAAVGDHLHPAGRTNLRGGEKMRRRYDDQDNHELAEQRLQEREQGAEDYLDHLYATGQISPDEYARLLEM